MVRPLVLALGLLTAWTVTVPALAGPAFCGLTGQPYESHAYDVSDDGRTIVGYGRPPSGYQGFRWNRADGLTWLGDLPDGDFSSRAYAVSADGSVVAGEGSIPWYSTGSYEAYRWTAETGLVGLGDFQTPLTASRAYGVSADGAIVVGHGGTTEAVYWTADNAIVRMGKPEDTQFNWAEDVSDDGQVIVGACRDFSGNPHAYRWTTAEGIVPLGDLPGGSDYSYAARVSPDGSVIVGAGTTADGLEGFRWTQADGFEALGDLPGGAHWSRAYDLTADGRFVVGASDTGIPLYQHLEAFIWDADHGMRDLKGVLENDYGLDLTGWTLVSARGISADGTVIVGEAVNPSLQFEAFVAIVPEPATLGLLAAAGAIALVPRRARQRRGTTTH